MNNWSIIKMREVNNDYSEHIQEILIKNKNNGTYGYVLIIDGELDEIKELLDVILNDKLFDHIHPLLENEILNQIINVNNLPFEYIAEDDYYSHLIDDFDCDEDYYDLIVDIVEYLEKEVK